LLAGEALQPTATATTVRVQRDKTITTDGPYAEVKEQLGGFYMIEAENLDQAIEWAAKMPHMAGGGAVEVRPSWNSRTTRVKGEPAPGRRVRVTG